MSRVTFEDVKANEAIRIYIKRADETLIAMGFTEHSFAHVGKCAQQAYEILNTLGYEKRICELAQIAAYMHDIGNVINREDHAQSGAIMAFRILDQMGMPADEISTVITAIGNHDESTAVPVNAVAAALILADKCDVRRSRVRNRDIASFDIHDRVNYAVERSEMTLADDKTAVTLDLTIDPKICPVMNYFEIFLGRMLLCRRAADYLNLKFKLIINGLDVM
ncbi:HD domain-containing protein [Hydrogenoanaerobacterium sp.]|uniref:HD domain-containing protein n=1 Tax=Hydrogenoanaerobacterium sp. TaxID=2953763 RepID=UPI002898F911|nr:HD domain-containing protein [Hydrogenoanaerobacterium sp.]